MLIILSILSDAFFVALLVWCGYTDIQKRTVSNMVIILLLCHSFAHTVLIGLSGIEWWSIRQGWCYPYRSLLHGCEVAWAQAT